MKMSAKDIVEGRGLEVKPIVYPEHIPGLDPPRIDISALSPIREVTRLITYRGTTDAMAKQLGRSLPDGLREESVDITVRTLDDSAGLLIGTADPVCGLLLRLGVVERELSVVRLALRDAREQAAEAVNRLALESGLKRPGDASKKTDSDFLGEVLAMVDSPEFGDDHTGVVNWLSDFAEAVRKSRQTPI